MGVWFRSPNGGLRKKVYKMARTTWFSIIAAVAVVSLPLSAKASNVGGGPPALSIIVGIEGEEMELNPAAEDNQDGTFSYLGQMTANPNWDLDWDMLVNPDPFISAVMGFTNNTGITQTFTLDVIMAIAPPVVPSSLMGGSIGLTLTDANNSGSATLASATPTAVYNGMIDGSPALPLLTDPYSLSVGVAGGSTTDGTSAGLPGPTIPGPAGLATIGISHKFTLSPGDRASLVSNFIIEAVPEPGTLSLVAIFFATMLVGSRRRQRN